MISDFIWPLCNRFQKVRVNVSGGIMRPPSDGGLKPNKKPEDRIAEETHPYLLCVHIFFAITCKDFCCHIFSCYVQFPNLHKVSWHYWKILVGNIQIVEKWTSCDGWYQLQNSDFQYCIWQFESIFAIG